MTKRILLEYTTGPHAGLLQIVGTDEQLFDYLKVTELPSFVPGMVFSVDGNRTNGASLVKVTPRTVLYRELLEWGKPVEEIHPAQQ